MNRVDFISIFWKMRKEEISILTEKIIASLEIIKDFFPQIYSQWFHLGDTPANAFKKQVSIDKETIEKILYRSKANRDDDLGVRISLWNGKETEEEQASFSANLGAYSEFVNNNFNLDFPESSYLTFENVTPLLVKLNTIFEGEQVKINGEIFDISEKKSKKIDTEKRKNARPGTTWSLLDD